MSRPGAWGNVYGPLLNFRSEWDAWSPQMAEPPYKGAPRAPVLYVKPANTWSAEGAAVATPGPVEVGATIGMVMRGPGEVAGYVLANDWSLPHASYFRPPVKARCRDGFLGVGDGWLDAGPSVDPAALAIEVRINDSWVQTVRFDALVRDARMLLRDVSEFMTLGAGDMLLLGAGAQRPLARPGDRVELRCDGLGSLAQTLVAEAP